MELYKEIISKSGVVSYIYLCTLQPSLGRDLYNSEFIELRKNEENYEGMPDKFLILIN